MVGRERRSSKGDFKVFSLWEDGVVEIEKFLSGVGLGNYLLVYNNDGSSFV